MTLATLAATFAAAFVTAKRDNGDSFVKLADGSPEWMSDIVRAAHDDGNRLPDDFRYRMIEQVADSIAEVLADDADADLDDDRAERIDGLIPVYNKDRLDWLASALFRADYCDDAADEGLVSERSTMFDRIAAGIGEELNEIWQAVASGLQDAADEEEPEDEEEEAED